MALVPSSRLAPLATLVSRLLGQFQTDLQMAQSLNKLASWRHCYSPGRQCDSSKMAPGESGNSSRWKGWTGMGRYC